MAWYLVVHQKKNGKDLAEPFETEQEAKDALEDVMKQFNESRGPGVMLSSKSGRIAFKVADFHGAVIRNGV